MAEMAKAILTDEMWKRIQHLFPAPPPRPKGGRKRLDYRRVLTGILFILRTGIPWHLLPQELGCGSGMTCWRRLRDWQQEGVWQHLLEYFVHELKLDGRLADDRLIVDASLVAAKKGAQQADPTHVIAASPAPNII